MSDLALFIVGVSVFTVTVMAVLWTGYLIFANAAEADQAGSASESAENPIDMPSATAPNASPQSVM